MQPALKAHSTTSKPFLGVCAEAQFNFFTKSFQFCTTMKFPVEFFSSEKRVFNAFSAMSFIPFKTTHIIKKSSNVSLQFWRENSNIFCTVNFLFCWLGFNLKNYRFHEARPKMFGKLNATFQSDFQRLCSFCWQLSTFLKIMIVDCLYNYEVKRRITSKKSEALRLAYWCPIS